RQKTQFTDEPDFRERATKTSGQVYSFLDLVNYNRTEQDTFIDFANLVADMDEGTAVQDGRFAGSVTPTQSDKAHQPVISNQSLLDTIDECAPVRADILILDDPIALVEDTLVVSGKHMADLVNWQNQNQNLQGLTQATAGFCHLQLKQSDPLAQELAKDPVKHAKAHVIISSSSLDAVNLESPSGQTFWMESLNNINQAMKKEGIVQSLPADLAYFNQMKQKRKWRGRVRMKEMNEYYLSSTVQETFLRTRLNWASNFTLALLDTVGPDPSCLFFDLYEEDHASQYIDTVTEWHTYLSPALNEQDRNKYNAQLRSQLALNNVMGSAMFAGVPEFKSFLAKLMDVVLSSYPNESFHQLASQVESEEALSDWLDKANAINLQSGRADQSAHVGALGAMFDAFTNDELANFTFFKKYVQVPYTNVQNSFLNAVAGKVENINVFSFNSWSTDVVLKEITEGWKHQSRFKMDVIMPMVLNNQLSGREVTLTPENKRQLLKLGGQYDEAMAGIAAVSKELEKSRLPQDRATLSTQIEVLEKEAKKISGSMGKHITFTDAAKKAIRVENIWQPMAQKGIDFATGNALTGVVIVLNFLALQQDYERILTSQNPSDSDTLTLVYRPLWLMESVVRVSQGYYQAQVREAFSLISSASKDIDNVINTSTIFHAIKGKDVALSKTLTKLLIFGVAAELTLVVAGAIESYQIYVYDFMPSSGKAKIAHGLKLAGTVSMTISGVLGLLAVLFKFTVASALSIASIGLQIFGGIIYSIGTAYLNYVQDDDISEWLKKTYWGDKNKWEGAQVWGNTLKGHEKAFDELSVIRNQPKLYTQPTLKTPGEVSEENADGAWLMLELPSELDGQKLRVDVLVYPDRDKLITPGKDYQFFHIDTLGLDGSRQWQAEWVKGYRPQPHKNEMWQEIIPQLPETKVLTPSQGKSLQTWQPTGDTQLLNLWLPRPWGPTGTWMFETCPAIMLVWYEYHLDKSTGKPKEGAVPHAFTLDLSLDTDVFGDTELSKSLKQVDIMKITDKDGFDAYNKAVSLARSIIAPNLLNVGY
ncbi:hypothetical protein MHO82_25500, partial [Vibrio sp. Of7-15]|uniref:hypothetical protein n=1 Tax=Vibrio sp. Of7-15 TaxID=2724879 RepID=UPI001EF2693E